MNDQQMAQGVAAQEQAESCFVCNKKIIIDSRQEDIGGYLRITHRGGFNYKTLCCHPECFFSAAGPDYRKALEFPPYVSKIDRAGEPFFDKSMFQTSSSFLGSLTFTAPEYESLNVSEVNRKMKEIDDLKQQLEKIEKNMYPAYYTPSEYESYFDSIGPHKKK